MYKFVGRGIGGFVICGIVVTAFTPLPSFAKDESANPSNIQLEDKLNQNLVDMLHQVGFTGGIEKTLEKRLGRKKNKQLADLGRLIFFDNILDSVVTR